MKRIVFFCIPAHGHTNPTLGVVQALTARGHTVLYYSYEPFREKIEAAGAAFFPCEEYDTQLHLSEAEAARVGSDLALSARVLVDTTLAMDDAIYAEIAQRKPDCIVADSMAPWGKAVAAKLGIPFVCSTTTFAFNRYSARIMKQSPRELLAMLLAMPKVQAQVRRLRSRGYPVKSFLDLVQSDDNTHTIVYTSAEFQPCAETFSDKFSFVGPSVRPAAESIQKTRDTLVYISMGTVNNDMLPLYQRCICALRDAPWQVILSVGSRIPGDAFPDLPDHISVFSHVDQIAVLEQADVFLSHCGMNSASESLYFGVPLVMLPQTSEQKGVAARIAQLGAGEYPNSTAPEAIRAALEQVLEDPAYRENAAKIADSFRRCGGSEAAADKIEALCR